ncbi:MAG: aminopeptidase [Verrucomicrobia bacterium]|nr:aminopeptidase [Verrucomicrobiota bacterium]
MKDPRVEKLANLLVDYSVKLKPRDIVAINGEAMRAPLAAAIKTAFVPITHTIKIAAE